MTFPGVTMVVLLLVVVGSMVTSVAGLALVYWAVPVMWLQPAQDVVGNYLQTLGTVYSVLLAFVVFMVWGQHNEALGYVHKEANDLLDMGRILRGLPDPLRSLGMERLRAYTRSLLDEEWDDMVHGRECVRAGVHLEELWDAVQEHEPRTPREESLFAEMLSRFNDLSDTRADRLRSAGTRIPNILWALLLSGGLVMVGSMYLFATRDFITHAVMTAALAGVLSHVLYVIWDLDNLFRGAWNVDRKPFEAVAQRLSGA